MLIVLGTVLFAGCATGPTADEQAAMVETARKASAMLAQTRWAEN